MKKIKNNAGFTILELLIATTVFGVMMLFATTGMIEIGRAYYKGITSSKTQEIARTVERDIANTVQGGADNTVTPGNLPTGLPADTYNYGVVSLCIGKSRYTYAPGVKSANVNDFSEPKTIKHALWYDVRNSSSGTCHALDLTRDNPSETPGTDTDDTDAAKAQRRDLLATNMRVARFDIVSRGPGVAIDIRVLYGDSAVIDDKDTATPADDTCLSKRAGGQFCAFSELNSFASKR